MELNTIRDLMLEAFPGAEVSVGGDDYHSRVNIVSNLFEGESSLQRQRRVYRVLSSHIESGEIHALTILAKTKAELSSQ